MITAISRLCVRRLSPATPISRNILSSAHKTQLLSRANFHTTPSHIEPVVESEHLQPALSTNLIESITSGKFDAVHEILSSIRPNDLSPANYINLLKSCRENRSPRTVSCALEIYRYGVQNLPAPDPETRETMLYFLMMTFLHCRSLAQLGQLKIIWNSFDHANSSMLPLYYSVFINCYLNAGLSFQAEEMYQKAFSDLNAKLPNKIISHVLPTKPMIQDLARLSDCDTLADIVELVRSEEEHKLHSNQKSIFDDLWLECLELGVAKNHYRLVKTILDRFIMKDFKAGTVTSEYVLMNTKVPELFSNSSLTDDIIMQILHVLASNGDVPSTLAIIESFYIHRAMKGQKALTKDLCLKVIESYCAHDEDADGGDDVSIKRVIDVIGDFNQRFERDPANRMTYKDVTSAISDKFIKFKVVDKNIEKTLRQRETIEEKIKESELNDVLTTVFPRKVSNPNLYESRQGNILANLEVLELFVRDHMQYLSSKNYTPATHTLFVNLLLNHVNIYQNFSGLVRLLNILHSINPEVCTQWLDEDSFNIILCSMANSNTSKPAAQLMFQHLKKIGTITQKQYSLLLGAIMRGDFYDEFEFFLFNALVDNNGHIHPSVRMRLQEVEPLVKNYPKIRDLCVYLQDEHTAEEVQNYFTLHSLCIGTPEIKDSMTVEGSNRKYYHDMAQRDAKILKYVLM